MRLVQRLKDEGFLRPGRGTKLEREDSSAQLAKREQMYCNPLTLIGHCVSISGFLLASLGLMILTDMGGQYESR